MESQLRIEIVGNYRYPQADIKDCKVCHDAKYATILVDGICLECLFKKQQEKIEELEKENITLKNNCNYLWKQLGQSSDTREDYIKETEKKLKQLQVVREAAEEVDIDVLKKLIKKYILDPDRNDYDLLCNLQQALVKVKDEAQ